MTNRLRICGLALAAALTASLLPAANTYLATSFHSSGPVTVSVQHSASVCVTNLGNRTVHTLLGFLNAQTTPNQVNNTAPNQILAVREAALGPGDGICLSKTGAELKIAAGANAAPGDGNIIAVVVPGGHFTGLADSNGIIIQGGSVVQSEGRSGGDGGGLVPSLQLFNGGTLVLTPNMASREVAPGPPNEH